MISERPIPDPLPQPYLITIIPSSVINTINNLWTVHVRSGIFKHYADQQAPVFTDIFNQSIKLSTVPACFKFNGHTSSQKVNNSEHKWLKTIHHPEISSHEDFWETYPYFAKIHHKLLWPIPPTVRLKILFKSYGVLWEWKQNGNLEILNLVPITVLFWHGWSGNQDIKLICWDRPWHCWQDKQYYGCQQQRVAFSLIRWFKHSICSIVR